MNIQTKPLDSAIQAGTPSIALPEEMELLRPKPRPKNLLVQIIAVVASLRITVTLFALSMLLVYWGTLAQVKNGIWTVVDRYFRSFPLVWIPSQTFFSNVNYVNKLWDYGAKEPLFDLPGYIPFPGGWLLGSLLLLNLLAGNIMQSLDSIQRYDPRKPWTQLRTYIARRSGILLIHTGMIVMMLGELITGKFAVEGTMAIEEGQTINYVTYPGSTEFAVIRPIDAKKDDVVAVPASILRSHLSREQTIDDARLPFKVDVKEFMVNSEINDLVDMKSHANPANAGIGKHILAIEEPEVSGVATEQKHDTPSAYVTLTDRGNGKVLGTYLVSVHFPEPQPVKLSTGDYHIALRFKRAYKDYAFTLNKFQFKKFQGDDKARDYRSFIHLQDPTHSEDRSIEIYMNNPLRYHGETFYQSSFFGGDRGRANGTILQVVRNPGAELPYISCLMVALGMLLHFGIKLIQFVDKRGAR